MDQLYLLLDAGLYYDALEYLCQYGEPSSAEYLFYLGYIQAHLGWTEEAIQTLTKYKIKEKDTELMGTISGLLADIYHNKGMLFDAISEISKALVIEPDCSLIQKKAEEIVKDLDNFFQGINFLLILVYYKTWRKIC
ncbi:MAG: tetratricopeptide repeat protein [Candidatus Marinimicrobia bacterium]|nr:tetratricopeptide repeat protein [Candidatus Neomarinimicrobiota bacterium]